MSEDSDDGEKKSKKKRPTLKGQPETYSKKSASKSRDKKSDDDG